MFKVIKKKIISENQMRMKENITKLKNVFLVI